MQNKIKYYYFETIVFILFSCYLYYIIEPVLLYVVQDNVFFTTTGFFLDHIKYPGGILDYLNSFSIELLRISWIGALLLTAVALAIVLISKQVFKQFGIKENMFYLHLMPLIFLTALYSNHTSEIYFLASFGTLITLLAFMVFNRWQSSSITKNTLLGWILAFVVYYTAVDMVYFFLFLCIIRILNVNKESLLQTFFLLLFPLIIPWLSYTYFFVITHKEAYFKIMFPENIDPVFILMLLTYLVITMGLRFYKDKGIKRLKNPFFAMPIILLCLAGSAYYTFDPENKQTDQYIYLAREHDWDEIISLSQHTKAFDNLRIFLINRAMCHKRILLTKFFSIPQNLKFDGLVLSRDYSIALPLLKSDFYMDIGLINQANHWAHEALSIKGETPLILKRLAEVNLIKNKLDAADMFLRKLKNTIWEKQWAVSYLEALQKDATLASDQEIQSERHLVLTEDFVTWGSFVQLDLEKILKQGKGTRMTYEYLMIYYLLDKKYKNFLALLPSIGNYGYQKIPKLFAEAFLVYLSSTKASIKPYEKIIDPVYIVRFNEFQRLLKSAGENFQGMQTQLDQQFGDTYWYYLITQEKKL